MQRMIRQYPTAGVKPIVMVEVTQHAKTLLEPINDASVVRIYNGLFSSAEILLS